MCCCEQKSSILAASRATYTHNYNYTGAHFVLRCWGLPLFHLGGATVVELCYHDKVTSSGTGFQKESRLESHNPG